MSLNAALRLMAGTVILISLALGAYINANWFYLTGFVGLNLLQSGFTKWCPAVFIFQKMGLKAETCSTGMSVHQGLHIIAGSVVLLTVAAVMLLAMPANILIITAVVGVSLAQSAFTGWCPAMTVASMLGFKKPESA